MRFGDSVNVDIVRQKFDVDGRGPLGLDEYQSLACSTYLATLDGRDKIEFLLLGLYGEVGSLLSELKKKQRDRSAYVAYAHSAVEETGDALWYLANMAKASYLKLSVIAVGPEQIAATTIPRTFVDLEPQAALFEEPASNPAVQRSLLALAASTGGVIRRDQEVVGDIEIRRELAIIFGALRDAASQAHVSLERAALTNLLKVAERWPLKREWGPLYDENFHPDEQLPRRLQVVFHEREVNGITYAFQSVNGVNVGDRLTDNSAGEDDYRFHDVFHLAFAAILGWSPVLRALLKVKRKSVPRIDEQQDGARAIITEEGISNWIFAHGLRHGAFAKVDSLDFTLLKTIREMVRGYEVESRPFWMWEAAVLSGFSVFRELRRHRGGTVTADLLSRTLQYAAPAS